MNSFQAKVGWKRMGKRENKKLSFRFVPTRCVIKHSKKITKKLKKLINTVINSFQAKLGWKRRRKREIKIIVPFRSDPMRNRMFQKNKKKIQKIKKYHYEFISSQNRLEKDEKDGNKNFSSVSFLPNA